MDLIAISATTGLFGVVLAVAGFMLLETSLLVGLVVPGDLVVLLAGTTATDPMSFGSITAAAVVGSLGGATIGYLVGARFGRGLEQRVRRTRLGRRIGSDQWDQAERMLHRRGIVSFTISRYIAVVHTLVPVLAGTVRLPYRRFLPRIAFASAVFAASYTGAGMLAGSSYRAVANQLDAFGLIAALTVVVGVVPLMVMWVRRRTRDRTAPADEVPRRLTVTDARRP